MLYSPVSNNRGILIKGRGPTDNLNINKQECPNKRGGLKIVFSQKWQLVIINYKDCFG